MLKIELPELPEELNKEYELFVPKRTISKNEEEFLDILLSKQYEYDYLKKMYIEYVKEICDDLRARNV